VLKIAAGVWLGIMLVIATPFVVLSLVLFGLAWTFVWIGSIVGLVLIILGIYWTIHDRPRG
jgi:hypothetical protein